MQPKAGKQKQNDENDPVAENDPIDENEAAKSKYINPHHGNSCPG